MVAAGVVFTGLNLAGADIAYDSVDVNQQGLTISEAREQSRLALENFPDNFLYWATLPGEKLGYAIARETQNVPENPRELFARLEANPSNGNLKKRASIYIGRALENIGLHPEYR